jgi:hypothetical protein
VDLYDRLKIAHGQAPEPWAAPGTPPGGGYGGPGGGYGAGGGYDAPGGGPAAPGGGGYGPQQP